MMTAMRNIEIWATRFDDVCGRTRSEFASPEMMKEMQATVPEGIQVGIGFFQALAGKRAAELLAEVIHSLNRRRIYAAALVTRGFIETAAAAAYCESKVTPMLTRGIETQSQLDELLDFLNQISTLGRFDWARWLLAGEPRDSLKRDYAAGLGPKAVRQQVNIMTMLKTLDRRLTAVASENKGMIRLAYDLLCDICHPSVGGYLFHVAAASKPGWLSIGREVTPDQLRWYCANTTVPVLDGEARVAAKALSDLTYVGKSLREERVE